MIATLKEDNEALAETPSPIDEWDLGKIPQFGAWVDLSAPPNPLGNVFDPKDTPLVTLHLLLQNGSPSVPQQVVQNGIGQLHDTQQL